MNFIEQINSALVDYLKRVYSIDAVQAELDEVVVVDNSGCSCYGSNLEFDIRYKLSSSAPGWLYQAVKGDVIEFLYSLQSYQED